MRGFQGYKFCIKNLCTCRYLDSAYTRKYYLYRLLQLNCSINNRAHVIDLAVAPNKLYDLWKLTNAGDDDVPFIFTIVMRTYDNFNNKLQLQRFDHLNHLSSSGDITTT